ncbi:MAG: double zinc ribbon domain-containing protein [Clostridia bacterium]|nr:double zinc ribbon domain-containing protein [Clostridia bacterium]
MSAGRRLLDYVFPKDAKCVGCGNVSGAVKDGFCEACRTRLERIRVTSEDGRCPRCLARLNPSGRCVHCETMTGRIRRGTFSFAYEAPASGAVRAFKYGGEGWLSGWMAAQMLCAPRASHMLSECDVLVCAPMDVLRRNRRGYNHAWLLTRELSRLSGIPAQDALRRKPFVSQQAKLGREERLRNLHGVIRCAGDFRGRRVLLVDDVRTTGATASACAGTLIEAGAMGVDLLTFAGA